MVVLFYVGQGLLFLLGFTKDGLKSTRMITPRQSLALIELAVERVPADSSGRMSKTSEIKNWNDPAIAITNQGLKLPRIPIATVVRQDKSGTTYAFTKHLDAISEKWRVQQGPTTLLSGLGNSLWAKGDEGVATLIKQSIGSLGYVSYAFASRLGLKLAVLENKEGKFVKPTEQSCAAALATAEMPENLRIFVPDPSGLDAYPIVTFSWILLYKDYPDTEKATSMRDLFQWCLLDGQNYATKFGYVPLPTSITEKALAALNTVGPRERL